MRVVLLTDSSDETLVRLIKERSVGLIVVGMKDGAPKYYRNDDGAVDNVKEDRTEYPKLFQSMAAARKRCQALAHQVGFAPGTTWHLAAWTRPEASCQPLDKYAKMDGGEFPGCPTQ